MLQKVQNGQRDVTTKITQHLLEREVTQIQEISEKIEEQVKYITQQYEEFKVKIKNYTISSWRGSRASHKIVLGACSQAVLG